MESSIPNSEGKDEEQKLDNKQGASTIQLLLLFSAVFIDLLGFGVIIPILAFLNKRLGGTATDYGLIIAIYSFMQFIFAPIWGTISDRVGRKPIIVIGLGGSVIGFTIFGYATELWHLYAARGFAGIFTAATLTVANAYIADVTPPEERGSAYRLITAAFGLGFAIGPGIGGILAEFHGLDFLLRHIVPTLGSHVVPSFFAAALAFLNMLGAINYLPESLQEKILEREGSRFAILDTFKYLDHEDTLLYILVFSLVAFGLSTFIAAFPNFAIEIDDTVDEAALGLYFTYIGLILFIMQTFAMKPLIKKFGESLIVKFGLLLVIIGFISMPFVPNFYWTFVPNTFFVTGIACLMPTMNSLISNSVSQAKQGNIMGLSQGWSAFARMIGPVYGGYSFEFGKAIPFVSSGLLYAVLLIVAFSKFNKSPGKVE